MFRESALASALLVAVAAVFTAAQLGEECPEQCVCVALYVGCSSKRLTALPPVPRWAEDLDLANNQLEDDGISELDLDLTRLNLNKNRLRSVPSVTTMRRLEELSLNGNKIQFIESEAFGQNSSLKVLHLNNNQITTLREGTLDNLGKLISLKLSRNNITNLPSELFKRLIRLKTLELNENKLSILKYNVFQGLEQLTALRLKNNDIDDITSGAFFGFKSLDSLQLDHNKISSISKGWMYGLESLATMSLSYNSIYKFDADCWELSSNLKELDLSHNKIRSVDGPTFKHLKKLKILNLSGNRISSISQDAFGHTPLLKNLQLDNNKISWTVEDMVGPFSKLNNLQTFTLASNHIKSINSRAFEGLSKLEVLDLRSNNITSIQQHAFDALSNISKVHMNGSSLLCDCNLQWISKWIQNRIEPESVKLMSATCAYPAELRGLPISRLKDSNCGDSPKPRVVQHPKTQKAIKGNSTHLICAATSNPFSNMTFLWRKNNVNISEPIVKENITVTDKAQRVVISELIIPNVTHSDDGKYQCLVSNDFGTTYSKKAEIKIVIFPRFTKTPMNITVKTGATVSLNCAATGDPSPEISWKKDGGNDFPAARERRMNVMPKDHMFFIIGAKTDDEGVYSCAAKNSGGTIIANATLSVEPPSVRSASKEVKTGEDVFIQCMISGSPKSQLAWFKDGKPIITTERHSFTAEGQLLIIEKAESDDAGNYECEITNSLGKDGEKRRRLTELTVILAAEDMTGIIIITVVCCAVVTSIIWVVIIYHYQTRKRMARSAPSFPPESINMTNVHMESETGPQMFSDTVSERSSCKDSGTGDSAKQSSFDDPTDRSVIQFESSVATHYSPVSEVHKLLPSSFKPSIQVCVNTSVSPATYSFSSHNDKDMS